MEEEQKNEDTREKSTEETDTTEESVRGGGENEEENKEEKKVKKKKKPAKKKKKGSLKKEFTTVTPFSKLLTLALFIILPFVAFMFGTEMSDLTDVYSFLDTNKGEKQVASTTTEVVTKYKYIDTFKFVDRHHEFEFEYLSEWGALEYIYKPVFISEEDTENPEYVDIDFDEVQIQRWYTHFNEIPCFEKEDCFASIQVYTYEKDYPLKLLCEEEECWTEDLEEDEDFVEENHDFESNELYWYCESGVYTTDSMLGLSCRTYTNEAYIQIKTGYTVSDLDEVREVCSENLSNVECTKEFVKNEKEYISFNKGLSVILESLKELE